MFRAEPLNVGLILFILGVAFWVGSVVLTRFTSRLKMQTPPETPRMDRGDLDEQSDALITVQPGGKVYTLNARAHELFHLNQEEIPNLERLSRRIRPSDTFLRMCVVEGQGRFILDGRPVDASSHRISFGDTPYMLISLRLSELVGQLSSEQSSVSSRTLQTFTELTQKMASSLDLESAIRATLESIDKVLPAEYMQISIWDGDTEVLTPYRYHAFAHPDRKLDRAVERNVLGQGFNGQIAQKRQPLVIPILDPTTASQNSDTNLALVRSYLGVPLLVGKSLIGTLELGSLSPEQFQDTDLQLLQIVSGQAAVAVHNALLFGAQQRRNQELTGLAQLSTAFIPTLDLDSTYARLLASIAPLVPVQIMGFLIYNDSSHHLEGKVPFKGFPAQFLKMYHMEIEVSSPLEKSFLDQDVIISENASQDPQWEALGISQLAKGASLRETALVPLVSGGRMLGYLQGSNHTDGNTAFSQRELDLLTIMANQVAPLIDNVTLIQQTRQRALRAEALRRIASLASSTATLDEILKFSLQELAELLQAEVGMIMLLDPDRITLKIDAQSVYGIKEELSTSKTSLLVDDPQFPFTVTGRLHNFITDRISEEPAVIPFYQQIAGALKIESMAAVPLIVRNTGVGEVILGARDAESFDRTEMQVIITAAGQVAAVVEQAYLREQTDESLRRKVDQMTALTRISRELSTTLNLDYLLQLLHQESLRTTGADCGTILLFDTQTDPVTLRQSVGCEPSEALLPLDLLILKNGEMVVIHEVNTSAYEAPHEGIHSLLCVPVFYQQKPIGVIQLHGKQPNLFDSSAIEFAQSLAAQATLALGNAMQYDQQIQRTDLLSRELDTIGNLFKLFRTLRPDRPLEEDLQTIAQAIKDSSPFDVVLISICDTHTHVLHRTVHVGLDEVDWNELRIHSQPWRSLEHFFQPEYQQGEVYFVPTERKPVDPEDLHTITILPDSQTAGIDAWNPDDLLLVPLRLADGEPLGVISLDAPRDNRRPDAPTYEALGLFALQASLTVDHHNRAKELSDKIYTLEVTASQVQQTGGSSQSLPLLLHKELDHVLSIHALQRQVERARAGLEIAELAGRQSDIPAVIRMVGREILTRFDMRCVVLAEREGSREQLIDVLGEMPDEFSAEVTFGQRNPLRQVLQDGKLLICEDLDNDPGDWKSTPMLSSLNAHCFIGVPLAVGANHVAAVLAVTNWAIPALSEEDRNVFLQLSRQVSIGLQNLRLLTETRQQLSEVDLLLAFTQKLGSLDPQSILETLISSTLEAVPAAVAGWVGLWDRQKERLVPRVAHGYSDNASMLEINYMQEGGGSDSSVGVGSLPVRVLASGKSRRVDEVQFARDYNLSSQDLLRYRKATAGRLPSSSLLAPIRLGEQLLGVVVLDNYSETGAFSEDSEALLNSLAQQTALALENARLFVESGNRTAQLQALNQVAGAIASSLQSEELITSLLEQLKSILPYETATLWLRQGDHLSVAAASGFEDTERRLGLTVALKDSALFQAMKHSSQAISVGDVRKDVRFPSLVEPENQSWLGLPLLSKAELAGMIALEKRDPYFYTGEHIQAGMTFASQAAVALENARLFEESMRRATELDDRSRRLAMLNRFSSEIGAFLDVEPILMLTVQQMQGALSVMAAAVVVPVDAVTIEIRAEAPEPGQSLPIQLASTQLIDQLRNSQGVFNTDDIIHEREAGSLIEAYFQSRRTHGLLMLPMISGQNLLGWVWLQKEKAERFSAAEIELARTFVNQASIAVQNARQFAEIRSLTEGLEQLITERTQELRREHQSTQTLLSIITELSTSLDMGMVLNRTLGVLNQSVEAQTSLVVMTQGSGQVYMAGEELLKMETRGRISADAPEWEIARWVTRQRGSALVDDISGDARWKFQAGTVFNYRSLMAVPLALGEDVLGVLMLFHRDPGHFIIDQIGLVEASARQISIALNNAELFSLIRDQSENLGSMLRDQQVEASRSRAILEAVADGVLVTDAGKNITLFNASAESILGLKAADLIGQTLDMFSGLFGTSTLAWAQTINTWSETPGEHTPGEVYAEQIELENGSVVAVNLAPVKFRSDFMGTVSVFRDITHEVEVDRLKSEFVTNVSHELRTPMTSIKGYIDIMLMGAAGQVNEQQAHFLRVVKENIERLSILVGDLLDISRIDSGKVTLSVHPVNLSPMIEDVLLSMQKRSKEDGKPMSFRMDVPDSLPQISADPQRLNQILTSLISNGYQYTPPEGEVVVSATQMDGELLITVKDNGIGILPENKTRVFQRFFRGDDALVMATSGTGLGLSLSKSLVEMHHGRIWFESSGVRGEGSAFTFTMPVYQVEG